VKRVLSALTTAAALAVPSEVWACPVCAPQNDEASRLAFFNTTVFLTLLPLGMFAGLIYFAVRRMQAMDDASQLERPAGEHVPDALPNETQA
jgi:hypothetical protein